MNILAIDYGKKKIGLAFAQTGLDLVLPLGQIAGSDDRLKREKIKRLVEERKIDKIIIGLPLGLKGEENDNTDRVRLFAEKLSALCGVETELLDERFTSRLADQMGGTISRDEKAAMVILQNYLDKK